MQVYAGKDLSSAAEALVGGVRTGQPKRELRAGVAQAFERFIERQTDRWLAEEEAGGKGGLAQLIYKGRREKVIAKAKQPERPAAPRRLERKKKSPRYPPEEYFLDRAEARLLSQGREVKRAGPGLKGFRFFVDGELVAHGMTRGEAADQLRRWAREVGETGLLR